MEFQQLLQMSCRHMCSSGIAHPAGATCILLHFELLSMTPQIWPVIHTSLVNSGLKTVSPEEVRASTLIVFSCQKSQSSAVACNANDQPEGHLQPESRPGCKQAEDLAAKDAVLVDVRTQANYDKEHIKDAVCLGML